MIRLLARLVVRQVCTPLEEILDEPDPPPVLCPNVGQVPCVSRAASCAPAPEQGTQASDAVRWAEEQTLALVVLFTQLAQRRVQAARAQEETHEYGSHHHGSPRADGVRLRQTIHSVAGP